MSQPQTKFVTVALVFLLFLRVACSTAHTSSATIASVSPSTATTAPPPVAHNDASQVPRVTVEELKKLLADKKAMVIDVRSLDAYESKHIKGSISLPLDKIQAGEVKSLPKDKQLITYCSCPAENSSSVAAEALVKAGFKNVGVLLGGTAAWENAGGEMEKGKPGAKS
jgi:rhodanese-related sulfurtransferase